jgi:hypothetical protein
MTIPQEALAVVNYSARRILGSMSALVAVNIAIVVLVLLFGVSVLLMFRDRGLLQSQAESTSLKNAVYLNVNDRAEQINNLVARSRELVFNSRQSANAAIGNHQYLQPLAAQLLMLSRESAIKILKEKRRLVHSTLSELRLQNRNIDSGWNGLSLPGGQVSKVVDLEVGSMADQTTNIACQPGNAALFSHDINAKYISQPSNEYMPLVNLKLPDADSDLEFTLSPMPRCNEAKPAQARLVKGRDFKAYCCLVKGGSETAEECKEFPCAQRIAISRRDKPLNGREAVIVTGAAASTNCLGTVP